LAKARHLPIERAFGGAGVGRALGWRLAEEDDPPNLLIGPLPRRPCQERDLVPAVGWLDPQPWQHSSRPLAMPAPF
jgi:hypothetical protein